MSDLRRQPQRLLRLAGPALIGRCRHAAGQVFERHSRRYGVRRITAELQATGHIYGRRRVRRIMQAEGLHAIQPQSFVPRTTDSRHGARMCPNLLPGLVIERPHQVFVGDITYLPLEGGRWAYEGFVAGLILAPHHGLASGSDDDGGVDYRRFAAINRAGATGARTDRP